MVEMEGKLNNHPIAILIDYGDSHSHLCEISTNAVTINLSSNLCNLFVLRNITKNNDKFTTAILHKIKTLQLINNAHT